MILKNISRNKAIIIAIISFALGALIYNYSKVIFQEGNPWPQIKGISQLTFGNQGLVKLDVEENKYITKSDDPEIIKSFMKERGYEFREQLGSAYLFKSPSGSSAIAVYRHYSCYYSLWTINENINDNKNDLWRTATTDSGETFQYPKELLTKYISIVNWPPLVKMVTGSFSCATTPQEVSSISDITSQRLVDDRSYCVNVEHEGAAGSVYSSYIYITAKDNKLVEVSFTLRYPNCSNYNEEESKACVSEREAFDIDATVDEIVQTIK